MRFTIRGSDRDWMDAPDDFRESLMAWMRDNGIDPNETRSITLGEGYVTAEHVGHPPVVANELNIETRVYPVQTLPPGWLTRADNDDEGEVHG